MDAQRMATAMRRRRGVGDSRREGLNAVERWGEDGDGGGGEQDGAFDAAELTVGGYAVEGDEGAGEEEERGGEGAEVALPELGSELRDEGEQRDREEWEPEKGEEFFQRLHEAEADESEAALFGYSAIRREQDRDGDVIEGEDGGREGCGGEDECEGLGEEVPRLCLGGMGDGIVG